MSEDAMQEVLDQREFIARVIELGNTPLTRHSCNG
jgi:hypothetical protein